MHSHHSLSILYFLSFFLFAFVSPQSHAHICLHVHTFVHALNFAFVVLHISLSSFFLADRSLSFKWLPCTSPRVSPATYQNNKIEWLFLVFFHHVPHTQCSAVATVTKHHTRIHIFVPQFIFLLFPIESTKYGNSSNSKKKQRRVETNSKNKT